MGGTVSIALEMVEGKGCVAKFLVCRSPFARSALLTESHSYSAGLGAPPGTRKWRRVRRRALVRRAIDTWAQDPSRSYSRYASPSLGVLVVRLSPRAGVRNRRSDRFLGEKNSDRRAWMIERTQERKRDGWRRGQWRVGGYVGHRPDRNLNLLV